MTAKDVQDPAGVSYVQFAVWSSNSGQDDLASYYVYDGSDGGWSTSIDISKHKNDTGKYFVDVYACDKLGNRSYYGQTVVSVITNDTVAPTLKSISPENNSLVGQTFTLQANGVADPSGVAKVTFNIYNKNSGETYSKEYTAINNGENTWSCTIDLKELYYQQGTYHVDIYAADNCGNSGHIGQVELIADFPIDGYDIMGTSNTDAAQLARYYQSSGHTFPNYYSELNAEGISRNVDLNKFCQMYIEESAAEGVRAEVAFAQAMNETGWLQYGGMVPREYFNFAGLGAFDGQPVGTGANFAEKYGDNETGIRMGIRAQIQHLKCYASTSPLNQACVDPRFDAAANTHGRGSATMVEELGGKWSTNPAYGFKLVNMINNLLSS